MSCSIEDRRASFLAAMVFLPFSIFASCADPVVPEPDASTDADLPSCPNCQLLDAPLCHRLVCNEATATCEPEAFDDDTPCNAPDSCSVSETCQRGECTAGEPLECHDPSPCRRGRCDGELDRCHVEDAEDGTPCSNACVVGGVCSAGKCIGPTADCSWLSDTCAEGRCHLESGECYRSPRSAGTNCDGSVAACSTGACNGMGNCVASPRPEGTACPEADSACAVGSCDGRGLCAAIPLEIGVPCAEADSACEQGLCDGVGVCTPEPLEDGIECDDSIPCSSDESCLAGVCSGVAITECASGDGCCPAGCSGDSDCCTVDGPLVDPEHWYLIGSARVDEALGQVVLTPAENFQLGQMWLNHDLTEPFVARFRFRAASGPWAADGIVLIFYKDREYLARAGGSLGFADADGCDVEALGTGYGVVIDNYQNGCDADGAHVAIVRNTLVDVLAQVPDARTEDGEWHDVEVVVGEASIAVSMDGELLLSWEGELDRSFGGFAIGATTGGANDEYVVSDVEILCL